MSFPIVPVQIKNFTGGWFQQLYNYLVSLRAALVASSITRAQWGVGATLTTLGGSWLPRWIDPLVATAGGSPPTNTPLEAVAGELTTITYSYVGAVANGSTPKVAFSIFVNGSNAGATGLLPTNVATPTTGSVTFPAYAFPAGAQIECVADISAGLTTALTDVLVSAGG